MNKKDSPSLWCIYHIPTAKGYEGLLYDEVRAVATTHKPAEWLVWREGWPDWRYMSEYAGFEEPLIRPLSLESPPEIPETLVQSEPNSEPNSEAKKENIGSIHRIDKLREQAEQTSTSVDLTSSGDNPIAATLADNIDLSDQAVPYENIVHIKRKSKRYDRRYEIVISKDGQTFKTYSVDVSVGGLKLQDPLPDWVENQFRVRVKRGKSQVELMAYRLGQSKNKSKSDPYRLGFLPLKNEGDESNLENWLKAS